VQALLEGIGWGLFLTILIGPIFFALVQAGIEYGFRAGVAVGLGIWLSDLLFIGLMFYSFNYIQEVVAIEGFDRWLGLIGGVILILFGVGTFLKPPPKIDFSGQLNVDRKNPYGALFAKGFLVNSLNPFTVGFWLAMMSGLGSKVHWGNSEYYIFFGSIMGTIIFTDSLKAFLAKLIRKNLKQKHLVIARKATGIILFGFGIALILRTWWIR